MCSRISIVNLVARRAATLTGAVGVGLLLISTLASAESPIGCNANLFNQSIAKNPPLVAVPGQIVNYQVDLFNLTSVGTQVGCDVNAVTANFFCPDAAGNSTVLQSNLVTNATFTANPPQSQSFGSIVNPPQSSLFCVMPNISGSAQAKVGGSGNLLDTADPTIQDLFNIDKTVSINVTPVNIKVDKQISCDGGTTWVDQGLVNGNEDNTNGCSAVDPAIIMVRYQAENATPITNPRTAYSCTLTDSNTGFSGTIPIGDLAAGQTTDFIPAQHTQQCNVGDSGQPGTEPNTVTLDCFTTADLNPDLKVAAFDTATYRCQSTPGLSVTKTCTPTDSGVDNVAIIVSATQADTNLTNCQVTDNIYSSATCPPTGSSTPVSVSPSTFDLAAGGSQPVTGTVGPLSANECNNVSVTCTDAAGHTVGPATDNAICPGHGQGCLTRTPGYWAEHPNTTAQYLPQTVCGTTLNNVSAGNGNSAIEAMCSVGTDGKILGQQLTQLIRQCTAAELNIAASTAGGGNCTTSFPQLTTLIASCCGTQSVCNGDTVAGYTVGSCIDQLDGFNNSFDTLAPFGPFVGSQKADSSICRASKNNGVVVSPTP